MSDTELVDISDTNDDVIRLITDGGVITCSRELLCKNSDYFRAMFNSRMRESAQTDVTLHDVDAKSLRALVSYREDDLLSLDDVSVWPLLMTSRMLQFVGVAERCERYVFEQLRSPDTDLGTMLSIYKHASSLLIQTLSSFAKKFLLYNFKSVSKLGNFYSLSSHDFIGIVNSDFLDVTSECDVLEAVLRYCDVNDVDPNTQRELFECVRFNAIDGASLRKVMASDDMKERVQRFGIEEKLNGALQRATPATLSRGFPTEVYFVLRTSVKDGKLTMCRFRKDKNALQVVTQTPIAAGLMGYRVCSARESLYIVGGELNQIGSGQWMNDVWMYNSMCKQWRIVAKLSQPRRNHVMCCDVSGNLFVAGGYGRFRVRLSSVYMLSAASGQWTELGQLPTNVLLFNAMLRHDDLLLGIHGFDIYALSLTSPSDWTKLEVEWPSYELVQDRALWHLHKHLVRDDVIYYIGDRILACPLNGDRTYKEIANMNKLNKPNLSILDTAVMATRRADDGGMATTIMLALEDRSVDFGTLHVYEHSVGTDSEEAGTLHENVAVPHDLLTSFSSQIAVLPVVSDD